MKVTLLAARPRARARRRGLRRRGRRRCGGPDADGGVGRGLLRRNRRLAGRAETATGELRKYRSLSQEGFDQAGTDIRSATEDSPSELRASARPTPSRERRRGRPSRRSRLPPKRDLADIERRGRQRLRGMAGISKAIVPSPRADLDERGVHDNGQSLRKIEPEEELQNALKSRVLRRSRG